MRSGRLLSILLLLQANRRMTARGLSARLEVSERTILRDMDALSAAGIPVVAERGAGGGWSLLGNYETRLTGLTQAEIDSLFVSRPERLLADLGWQRQSAAAWTKLQAALPDPVRRQADFARQRIWIDARGWREPGESLACLPVLLDALWRERQVSFLYARDSAEPLERVVHPLGLVAKGATWYLVAFTSEARTYRVSRIRDAMVRDEPAIRPEPFDLGAWWERSAADFREKLPRYYASFLANPAVMRWIRYRGWRLEEEIPDGARIRIRMRFDIEEEAIQFALSFAGAVEALEPPELRAKVLAGAEAIRQIYALPAGE